MWFFDSNSCSNVICRVLFLTVFKSIHFINQNIYVFILFVFKFRIRLKSLSMGCGKLKSKQIINDWTELSEKSAIDWYCECNDFVFLFLQYLLRKNIYKRVFSCKWLPPTRQLIRFVSQLNLIGLYFILPNLTIDKTCFAVAAMT